MTASVSIQMLAFSFPLTELLAWLQTLILVPQSEPSPEAAQTLQRTQVQNKSTSKLRFTRLVEKVTHLGSKCD